MKLLPFFFIVLSVSIASPIFGQEVKKAGKITALILEENIANYYQKGIKFQAFILDEEGVLEAKKDYEIVLDAKEKKFVVKPKSIKYPIADNVEVSDINGGKSVCHCGFGAADDCEFLGNPKPGEIHDCGGSCTCGQLIIWDIKSIGRFRTLDGEWHSNNYKK